MALSMKKLNRLLLNKLCYNIDTGQLKIYYKNMFNHPKNKKSKGFRFESHNNIKKNTIVNYVNEMLISKSYKDCKVIHPYLFSIAWPEIKKFFKVKKTESSFCNEVVPKSEFSQNINYRIQTRETLKITSLILGNKLIEDNFPDYYNYLFSDRGITVEERIDVNIPDVSRKRWVDIKFSFSEKINIYLEINEKHHDKIKDKLRAIEIFSRTNSMPIMYYQDEEDMTNLIPKIYLEMCYAIAKVDTLQALKFYLIVIDKLNPTFVNFSIDNMNSKRIEIQDIYDILKIYGMKNIKSYISELIKKNLLDEDNIDYEGKDLIGGNVSQIGCDIIFMRLENKYFKDLDKQCLASELCKQYSIIKQKYFKTLKVLLNHQQNHFKIIFENRNELENLYKNIKPINPMIHEMLEILFLNNNEELRDNIKLNFEFEVHPRYFFLIREEGKYIDNRTFKKISKAKYHDNEESSNNIVNYRWMKPEEWDNIKTLF